MIDLSFRFTERQIDDEAKIIEGVSLLGEKGSATVRFLGKECKIDSLSLDESKVDGKKPVWRFMLYLIDYLLKQVHRVQWREAEESKADCLSLIAEYEGKVEGSGRIRRKYTAGVSEIDGVKKYFVEVGKKVYVKRLSKPKDPPLPLPLSSTGLSLDIADVKAWNSAEFGRMEYIVLSRMGEQYWLFPYDEDEEAEKAFNEDLVEKGIFSAEEIDALRSWARSQVKDENSTLSQYFAQRRAEEEARCKALSQKRKADEERIKENLEKLAEQ